MTKIARIAAPLLTVLLLASPAYAASSPADQQDLAALKAQIAKLSAKIDQMEAPSAKKAKTVKSAAKEQVAATQSEPVAAPAAPAAEEVVTKGSFPGSIRIPGTDTSVKIGGYVKLDAIEDIGTGYGAPWAAFKNLPLENTQQAHQNSQTTFGAQQSRINFETRTASSLGEIKTFIEADFYGSSAANSNTSGYGLQLRHAYGSLGSAAKGQVLAGQTWSNFMDVAAMPETIDYIGPAGTIFVRQPQVRYTNSINAFTLSGSVEVPSNMTTQASSTYSVASATAAGTTVATRTVMPDLVANAKYDYAKDGYVSLRAVVNQINVDRGSASNNDTETKYGYGFALSGKQNVLAKDSIKYSLAVGEGTGRYVYDVSAGSNYYNSTTTSLDTQLYYAGTLGYQHVWSDQFRSNLFGGMTRIINDTDNMAASVATAATTNKIVASGHVNLIWQPAPAYQVGIEYMHGYRETQSGVDGTLDRTQASFSYNF